MATQNTGGIAYKKLSYHGNGLHNALSVETLSTAAKLYENSLAVDKQAHHRQHIQTAQVNFMVKKDHR